MASRLRGARPKDVPGLARRQRAALPSPFGAPPTAAEVAALRQATGLTQTEFGKLVYRSLRIVQDWEGGLRRCPPDTWEFLCLLHKFPAVARYRKLLRQQRRWP